MPSSFGPRLPKIHSVLSTIGEGVSLRFESTVFPESRSKIEAALSNLHGILSTRKGERVFMPEYGADLSAFAFEPQDDAMMSLADDQLREQVAMFVPQIRILTITPVPLVNGVKWDMWVVLNDDPNTPVQVEISPKN